MEWTDTLRLYAKMKGKKYHIPKKGTPEYDEVKTLQRTHGTKKKIRFVSKTPKAEGAPVSEAPKKMRKTRSDKGQKRMTALQIAKESVRQGLVSRAEALGRKVRSDKGKKRGARKPKVEAVNEPDEMFYYQ